MKIKLFNSFLTLLFLLASTLVWHANAQNNSFLPQNLGATVNTEFPEINPVLSSDGKTLFFNRINDPANYYGKHDSQDIWYSYLQPDGTWSTAKRLEVLFNNARHNAILCNLGQETYLIDGIYTSGKNPTWIKRGLSIVTRNDNDQWTPPQKLKVRGYTRLNEGIESNVWMSADKKALILSFTHHYKGKRNNLYVSLNQGGQWTKPKKLSKVINSRKTNEEAPFISVDNETLYFASNKGAQTRQDRKHNYQIYRSTRLDETWRMWSTPMPLSDTINSPEWDSYFRTNAKGSLAFFASTKNSLGQADLFKIKLFEENPFVVVKGTVINKAKNQPMAKGKKFTILADGNPIDSIWINPDSATFKIKLPLGKKYTIAPSLKNYKGIPEEIDVVGVREYTEVKKDLYLEPTRYVLVTGNVLVASPRSVIPSSSNPKIVVDGKRIDSIVIRYPEGAYELILPFGKSYTVAVDARKFVQDPIKLDFTKIDEYQEIKKDLFVKSNPMATINGHFYVKGTSQPIPAKSLPKLTINGEIVDSALIDSAKSTYKIVLPLHKTYNLSFAATKYQGIPSLLDLSNSNEAIDITRDLFGTFVSTSALVSGKVINRKTNKPLNTTETVRIQADGVDVPGAKYNPATSQYEVEIGLGAAHTVNANVPKHFPQYEIVDLSKEKGNVKVIKDLYVTPLEVGQSVKLNNIFFESGKSTLKPKSFPELNKVVKFLTDNPNIKIQIEGHTDNVGKPDANLKLSRWRARSVQQYLEKKGVAASRVKFEGYGQNKPVANNKTAQGRSLNRRVEFKILSVE